MAKAGINISLIGLANVTRLLSRDRGEAAERAARGALLRAAVLIEGRARRNAPVDTGHLRSLITHEPIEGGYLIGTNVEYARFVEFGTGRRGAGSALGVTASQTRRDLGYEYGARPGMPAQPFLFPAFEQSRDAVIAMIGEAVKREVEAA